ncbi:MAG: hypothetical protein JKY32_06960 [Rhizobiales bacterium]|nr:hypothetical protein [Hyphomicrobiales bacterium]
MKMIARSKGTSSFGRAMRRRAELPGLNKAMQSIGEDLKRNAESSLEETGLPDFLVRRLKRSLKLETRPDGNIVLTSDDPLAAQIETGTFGREARPWLLPALMDVRKQIRARLQTIVTGQDIAK